MLLVLLALPAGAARQAPDPQEVYDLIRTNLSGLTDAQLQTAAVEGLVKQLQPRVWLVENESQSNAAAGSAALSKSALFDGGVGYFRLGQVSPSLARDLKSACAEMARTNALKGIVLDARFADGEDYAAACSTADLFVANEQPLLDWGAASAHSTAKTNALRLPVAVLVNHQTSQAAEALAAILRDVGAALVIGTNTAGRATIAEEFPLKNGQRLRIAKAGIKLGSGAALSLQGVKPDIEVAVNAAEEKRFWADPFKDLSASTNLVGDTGTSSSTNTVAASTNRPPRRRINEAELVRERKEGTNLNDLLSGARESRATEAEPPMVRDPVLARALDLIKGLALVKQWRTQ
jgi:hypothetical protein